jgi:hypothetical protein
MNYEDDYPKFYRSNKIPTKGGLCRSPIELEYFRELDNDSDVVSYMPEPFKIPYDYNNKRLNYIPDVLIQYANGMKKLVEIKVLKEVSLPINIAKFNAAKEYAKNNEMVFKIVVRRVHGSHSNLPIVGEYDDHIAATKAENIWLYKRIVPHAAIFLILLIAVLTYGGIRDAIIFIFVVILMLFSVLKVMGRF